MSLIYVIHDLTKPRYTQKTGGYIGFVANYRVFPTFLGTITVFIAVSMFSIGGL